jgi:hypothetical protein
MRETLAVGIWYYSGGCALLVLSLAFLVIGFAR